MKHTWFLPAVALAGALFAIDLARPRATAVAGDEAKPTFIGADGCKKCHFKQFTSWKKTPMARAFDVLKPGEAADKKKAAGLDEKTDYTKDPKCLKCHTTAYGTDNGYPAVAEGKTWTPAEEERAKLTAAGTCEACHGPGGLYGPYKKDPAHEAFKFEEIQKLGAVKPAAEVCQPCHTKECPTMPKDYAFDFATKKDSKDIHDHIPLKHQH